MKRMKLWLLASLLAGTTLAGTTLSGCGSRTGAASGAGETADYADEAAEYAGETADYADETADYAGVYLDENRTDNNLVITADSAGGYHVSIDIFRLTSLDDGRGQATADGLAFTATDANGQPIGGVITLNGDTATVTFTDSHWPLLPNGEQFTYVAETAAAQSEN